MRIFPAGDGGGYQRPEAGGRVVDLASGLGWVAPYLPTVLACSWHFHGLFMTHPHPHVKGRGQHPLPRCQRRENGHYQGIFFPGGTQPGLTPPVNIYRIQPKEFSRCCGGGMRGVGWCWGGGATAGVWGFWVGDWIPEAGALDLPPSPTSLTRYRENEGR